MVEETFAGWLRERIETRNLTVRGLARRIAAADYPSGATVQNVETVRRALNKYLHEGRLPSGPMRESIADSLGATPDEMPPFGERPVTREDAARALDVLRRYTETTA